jgi:hypothetical protein
MAFYEIAFTTTATADAAPVAAIRAPTNAIRVVEIGWWNNAATASRVALFRNTNASYAASTSTSVGQKTDPASSAATGLVDTAWSAAPTITTTAMIRRAASAAAIGCGVVWCFNRSLNINPATPAHYLVLWNNSGGSTADSVLNGYVVFEE